MDQGLGSSRFKQLTGFDGVPEKVHGVKRVVQAMIRQIPKWQRQRMKAYLKSNSADYFSKTAQTPGHSTAHMEIKVKPLRHHIAQQCAKAPLLPSPLRLP